MKKRIFLIILSILIISLVGCAKEKHEKISRFSNEEDIIKPKEIVKEEIVKEDKKNEAEEKEIEESKEVKEEKEENEEEKLIIEDYYPFKENTTMDYEGIGNEYAEEKRFVEFVEENRVQIKIKNPGTNFVKVVENKNGTLTEVFSEGEFYHIENMINANTTNQDIILQEPLEVGNFWSTEEGFNRRITSMDKNIETPSGSYNALEVTMELDDGSTQKDYYAKDIGPIASIYKDEDIEVKTLLKKIIEEKYETNLLTYYPTFEDVGTGYIEQNIEFGTNDNVKDVLETIMKESPSEKLLGSITEKTQINNINLNRNSWTLEVDFSNELLTNHIGTALETEILKSIVNTLGEFYDVDKVYITVEGEAYESGHYGIEEDEYFEVDKENIIEIK